VGADQEAVGALVGGGSVATAAANEACAHIGYARLGTVRLHTPEAWDGVDTPDQQSQSQNNHEDLPGLRYPT
jgi:hypothetical protein